MLIVPDFVRNLIVAYLDGVLSWISAVIYADLIAHAADHFLVALQAALDFAPLEAACCGLSSRHGAGLSADASRAAVGARAGDQLLLQLVVAAT